MYPLIQIDTNNPVDFESENLSMCLGDPLELTEKLWFEQLHASSQGPYSRPPKIHELLKSAYITIKLLEARLV